MRYGSLLCLKLKIQNQKMHATELIWYEYILRDRYVLGIYMADATDTD